MTASELKKAFWRRWPLARLLAPLILLIAPWPAAALDKCIGADGKVTYSDHGCAGAAKRSTIGVDTSLEGVQIEYYDVAAPSAQIGHAVWFLSYTYRARSLADGGCAVGTLDTKLDLKVTLPRWTAGLSASQDAMSRWQRFIDGLRVHEAGHVQTGRDLESNFRRAAVAMKVQNCGALDAALRARFESLLEQSRQRDLDYDRDTRHGATQGAVF